MWIEEENGEIANDDRNIVKITLPEAETITNQVQSAIHVQAAEALPQAGPIWLLILYYFASIFANIVISIVAMILYKKKSIRSLAIVIIIESICDGNLRAMKNPGYILCCMIFGLIIGLIGTVTFVTDLNILSLANALVLLGRILVFFILVFALGCAKRNPNAANQQDEAQIVVNAV